VERTLQRLAVVGCAANALILASVQLVGAAKPPALLFVLFAGLWVFGGAMLLRAPTFGAVGTTMWGLLAGLQVLGMHGADATTLLVSVASLATAALAAWFAVARRRARKLGAVMT
jgi:hypothetical protein